MMFSEGLVDNPKQLPNNTVCGLVFSDLLFVTFAAKISDGDRLIFFGNL